MQSDGEFSEDLASCDGSNPAIVAALSCAIPLLTL